MIIWRHWFMTRKVVIVGNVNDFVWKHVSFTSKNSNATNICILCNLARGHFKNLPRMASAQVPNGFIKLSRRFRTWKKIKIKTYVRSQRALYVSLFYYQCFRKNYQCHKECRQKPDAIKFSWDFEERWRTYNIETSLEKRGVTRATPFGFMTLGRPGSRMLA